MTEERHVLADLFAECWKDDQLKARFIADPHTVLAERGFNVLEGGTLYIRAPAVFLLCYPEQPVSEVKKKIGSLASLLLFCM